MSNRNDQVLKYLPFNMSYKRKCRPKKVSSITNTISRYNHGRSPYVKKIMTYQKEAYLYSVEQISKKRTT